MAPHSSSCNGGTRPFAGNDGRTWADRPRFVAVCHGLSRLSNDFWLRLGAPEPPSIHLRLFSHCYPLPTRVPIYIWPLSPKVCIEKLRSTTPAQSVVFRLIECLTFKLQMPARTWVRVRLHSGSSLFGRSAMNFTTACVCGLWCVLSDRQPVA